MVIGPSYIKQGSYWRLKLYLLRLGRNLGNVPQSQCHLGQSECIVLCSLCIAGTCNILFIEFSLIGHHLKHSVIIPPPQNVGGGGLYWIRFVPSVGQTVRPSPIRVRSITPLLMEGFSLNLNDTFTSTRGCAKPILPMCQLKVKVTVKGQIFNKQILHIMSCPLYNSFTNTRISFKLEWHIHLN